MFGFFKRPLTVWYTVKTPMGRKIGKIDHDILVRLYDLGSIRELPNGNWMAVEGFTVGLSQGVKLTLEEGDIIKG